MAITNIHPRYTEWYTVNGESMANYGFGVDSIQTGLPERKGVNVTSPIIHGDVFREKRFGSRSETWNIWISDAHPVTGATPSTEGGKRAQFSENVDYVNSIFNKLTPYSTYNGALEIRRYNMVPLDSGNDIFYDSSDSSTVTFLTSNAHGISIGDKVSVDGMSPPTLNFDAKPVLAVTSTTFTVTNPYGAYNDAAPGFDGTGKGYGTIERMAYAEVTGAYTVEDHREFNQALISVEVRYPDPRWYATTSTQLSIPSVGTTYNFATSTFGNAPATSMLIVINATSTLVNPVLSNSTASMSQYPASIGFSGTLASGSYVTIDTESLTLTRTVSGVTSNAISSLYRGGYRQDWMEIYPSVQNSFLLTADSGTGNATIAFQKAYL